ncbi:MAG: WG repeat-containing protein [Christensenellaceae bacterium]|nr:WG repeat-containing protein [Christensenellaceae bacterium]
MVNKKNFEKDSNKKRDEKNRTNYIPPYDNNLLSQLVATLDISDDLKVKLSTGKVLTLRDITVRRAKDFYKIYTFNKKNLIELQSAIEKIGLSFRPQQILTGENKSTVTLAVSGDKKPKDLNVNTKQQKSNNPRQEVTKKIKTQGKSSLDSGLEKESPCITDQTQSLNSKDINQQKNLDSNNRKNEKKHKAIASGKKTNDKFQNDMQPTINQTKVFNQNNSELIKNERQKGKPVLNESSLKVGVDGLKTHNKSSKPQSDFNKIKSNQGSGKGSPQTKVQTRDLINDFLDRDKALSRVKKSKQKAKADELSPDIYIKINKNGKWGFVDRSKKQTVIQPIYDDLFTFKEGFCCAEIDNLFGFINRSGEHVIPFEYECALSFSEGYACVYKEGRCGYINIHNEVVVKFEYDAGTPVEEGSCRVKKNGKWGELSIANPNSIRWIV